MRSDEIPYPDLISGRSEDRILHFLFYHDSADIEQLAEWRDAEGKDRLRKARRIIEKLRRRGIDIRERIDRDSIKHYFLSPEGKSHYYDMLIQNNEKLINSIRYQQREFKNIDDLYLIEKKTREGFNLES
ncbi:MAG: hypothetical protein QXU18_05320 [Thermoplasmatales archaeon]